MGHMNYSRGYGKPTQWLIKVVYNQNKVVHNQGQIDQDNKYIDINSCNGQEYEVQ